MGAHRAAADRVALVARLRHRASGRRLLVLTSHLTVAHASNDHDIPHHRPLQMQQLLDQVQGAAPDDMVIISADLNCDHLEPEPPEKDDMVLLAEQDHGRHAALYGTAELRSRVDASAATARLCDFASSTPIQSTP